jgi:hypothetical protein
LTSSSRPATLRRGDDVSKPDGKRRNGPGSVDWETAEAFYLGLDPPRRLQRVVEKFSVSRVSVGKQAKARKWRDKAAEIDAQVAAGAMRRVRRSRAERVQKVLELVDSVVDGFTDDRLLEAKVSDLPALVKLAELLEGEATDRVDIRKVQPVIVAFVTRVAGCVAKEKQPEFAGHLDWLEGELLAIEGPGDQA